jgi:membrane protease YdiL (CAAX protease family)
LLSSIIVAAIWSLWHLPLFFIPDVSQFGANFGLFSINVLGLTFALGAVRKISGNVFLCVLLHCMVNAGLETLNIAQATLTGYILSSTLLIAISLIMVYVYKRNRKATQQALPK